MEGLRLRSRGYLSDSPELSALLLHVLRRLLLHSRSSVRGLHLRLSRMLRVGPDGGLRKRVELPPLERQRVLSASRDVGVRGPLQRRDLRLDKPGDSVRIDDHPFGDPATRQ